MKLRSRVLALSAISSVAVALVAITVPSGSAGAATAASNPSGMNIPGPIAGYKTVFWDDFSGTSVNATKWITYTGRPANDSLGNWLPSHDVVSGNALHIKGYRVKGSNGKTLFTTGGLRQRVGKTYGEYLVRARVAAGQGVAFIAMLWPASNTWPPEMDFAEDNGLPTRTMLNTTVHWKSATKTNAQKSLRYSGTIHTTGWHTYGIIWSKGKVQYVLDGHIWGTLTSTTAVIASVPMTLAIQTQAWNCKQETWEYCQTTATPLNVNMDIDWVAYYAKS